MITINSKFAVYGNVTKRDGGDADHTIHLKAFGKEFVVPLKRNLNILSPFANVLDTFVDPLTGNDCHLIDFYCASCENITTLQYKKTCIFSEVRS